MNKNTKGSNTILDASVERESVADLKSRDWHDQVITAKGGLDTGALGWRWMPRGH
ncbi:MAG: hypothetical protein AAF384_04470 [Pseudomonadota bacterium]